MEYFLGIKWPEREIDHLHLAPGLRMSRSIILLTLYAFRALTRKTLPLPLTFTSSSSSSSSSSGDSSGGVVVVVVVVVLVVLMVVEVWLW